LFQDLIDSLPIPGVFAVLALLALVLYELGFRLGRWWQARTLEEKEGPTAMLVGSILALMAFLLAGLTGRRSPLTAVCSSSSSVPSSRSSSTSSARRVGSLTVSQEPLVLLQEQIGPPSTAP
jgi:hypothetical protein